MFLPQNNSGHGNGSETVSPFGELINSYENAQGNTSKNERETVQTKKSSHSIFNFLSRRTRSSKVVDASA